MFGILLLIAYARHSTTAPSGPRQEPARRGRADSSAEPFRHHTGGGFENGEMSGTPTARARCAATGQQSRRETLQPDLAQASGLQ
jgi:hypothetical protein